MVAFRMLGFFEAQIDGSYHEETERVVYTTRISRE
jgi:hypothetical protein